MISEVVIPEKTAFFTKRAELDGVNYLLEFTFNQREDSFYVTVNDENGEFLVGPLKIVTNWPLLRWHRYEKRLPPGEFWAIDTRATDVNGISSEISPTPGYGVLGKTVGFYYYDLEETQL